ncbi:MAG: type II CAAX endopeptidase family protein [Flavobacteriaceae bacterium]
MRFKVITVLFFLVTMIMSSQETPNFGDSDSHEFYIKQLYDSKDINFQRTMGLYDAYMQQHRNDVVAQIERCKFIGNSYYDEYEDYNQKYEETEECIGMLYAAYPNVPAVLMYRAESLYGKERLEVLDIAKESIEEAQHLWSNLEKARFYAMLGDYYIEDQSLSLVNYKKAQELDDSTDYSLEMARILIDQGKNEAAKNTLLPNLEKDTTLWRMNSKADLLTRLGESEKALYLYELISERDSTFINNQEMAVVMSDMGNYEVARSFLVKDTIYEWNKTITLQKLFKHDLRHLSAEQALETYRSLQKSNSYDDFLGVKRLRIFFKNPLLGWKLSELLHFAISFIILLFLFIIPYLWVLPVSFVGDWVKRRRKSEFARKLNLDWTLRHFWIISFLYLTVQFVLSLAFYYEYTINDIFEIGSVYEDFIENDALLAQGMLAFVLLMAFATLAIVNKKNVGQIFASNMSVGRSIRISIGFIIFNVVLLKILKNFINIDEVELADLILNPEAEIAATLRTYGFFVAFLSAAVLGPVYEEIIFRGAILGSVEKHLGFIAANIFQACLFAIIHFDLRLFVFYFIFGIITGMYVRKTGGLRTGIILHMANNFFVLVLLSRMT